MQDTAKYLIHADITTSGVVERSDVVGAIFGQTEGLLGDELDLRELQQSSKIGRIDVEVESEGGRSTGEVTVASALDKVETAILAAAFETIDRVGPCRAEVEITGIEDVRAAKRRTVVERAQELLAEFESDAMSSAEIVEEVRRRVRVENITEYRGLPAGPRVENSDAVVVVEGRADVLTLLKHGIKNAIAVEGTDVPDAVADLSRDRTVTAFLDGDRGGDLILKELAQIGEVDYVAFAPAGRSVEDLSRGEVLSALREKVAYEEIADAGAPADVAATDGSTRPAPTDVPGPDAPDATPEAEPDAGATDPDATRAAEGAPAESTDEPSGDDAADAGGADTSADSDGTAADADGDALSAGDAPEVHEIEDADDLTRAPSDPETLAGHVEAVVGEGTGTVRLLDADFATLAEAPADEAFEAIEDADPAPATVIVDGALSQRVLDVAAQRGVEQIVARSEGQFVKQPTNVRVRTAEQVAA